MRISDWSSDVCSSDLQSLMIEMQASRSRDFLTFLAPLAREAFGGSGPAWQADNLLRHYTAVKPDFIRVDADEVTYPAHVILRYRLEKALIAGDMSLDDLPGEWNRGMQALLGITRSEEHTSELQSLMRISYAVFCLKKKKQQQTK